MKRGAIFLLTLIMLTGCGAALEPSGVSPIPDVAPSPPVADVVSPSPSSDEPAVEASAVWPLDAEYYVTLGDAGEIGDTPVFICYRQDDEDIVIYETSTDTQPVLCRAEHILYLTRGHHSFEELLALDLATGEVQLIVTAAATFLYDETDEAFYYASGNDLLVFSPELGRAQVIAELDDQYIPVSSEGEWLVAQSFSAFLRIHKFTGESQAS